MSILFQPACFSSSGSDHLNIRKINSKFSQRYLFHLPQVAFVFPALPPFFFEDSDFLIKYPFIDGKSLYSFASMFLSGDSQEDTNGASSLLFFVSFLLRWIQFKLSVLIISLSLFKCFLMPVHLLITHFSIFLRSRVLNISQKARLFIQDPFKLFGDYYLILVI